MVRSTSDMGWRLASRAICPVIAPKAPKAPKEPIYSAHHSGSCRGSVQTRSLSFRAFAPSQPGSFCIR
ncbi:hypothetical protein TNCV_3494771 [Trichonephila clavipes]|nr:hypothetical protein TNCV_3494771 [Trichonephila clavipes]